MAGPARFGDYTVVQPLGAGGMGCVQLDAALVSAFVSDEAALQAFFARQSQ